MLEAPEKCVAPATAVLRHKELPHPNGLLQVERPALGENNARHAAPLGLMLQPAGSQKLAVIPSPTLRDWQR